MSNNPRYRLPAEWEPQCAVMLTWPHEDTDWQPYLPDINRTYIEMARAITAHERLLIVTPDASGLRRQLAQELDLSRVGFCECPTDDTWARDHGPITLTSVSGSGERGAGSEERGAGGENRALLLDFCFNGWGGKFESRNDNAINRRAFTALQELFAPADADDAASGGRVDLQSHLDFVLEGGSIESDGQGTILTTTGCLMASGRNQPLGKDEIERELLRRLQATRILWIDHGHLEGDDTDGHIDTLVRMAPDNTLLYIRCDEPADEHYADLKAMEQQLRTLRDAQGQPYRLLPLPMTRPIVEADGHRLPATYANFLVINGAVLAPTYAQPDLDRQAIATLQTAFPDREIIPIDSRTIIRQHGSIHCCTMQLPALYTPKDNK